MENKIIKPKKRKQKLKKSAKKNTANSYVKNTLESSKQRNKKGI